MADLVIGSEGEIGSAILRNLKIKNFNTDSYDIINPNTNLNDYYDAIHVCIPYSNDFFEIIQNYIKTTKMLIIHSTIPPGTTNKIEKMKLNVNSNTEIIFSPVRGVHYDMDACLRFFTKYYYTSLGKFSIGFEKRFPQSLQKNNSIMMENSKLVATTSYAYNMAFQRYLEHKHPFYKDYFFELHQRYGCFPVFYNDHKPFGGHCLKPNAKLLNDKFITDFILEWG